jgi:ubiquinol-cytochrome c reductase iron-sulfur subunit
LVPLVDQMNPDASTLAAGGPVDLDVSKIDEGQQVMIRWRQRPIFVFRRSKQTLDALQSKQMTGQLADPNSEALQQPPYATNWHRSLNPEFSVLVGICTHLGCIPLFYPNASATTPVSNWPGGYFCPCHGSKYDAAGRVYSGVPAPYNLPVPPYRFVNDKTLRVGENDASAAAWNFDSIRQL